MSEPDSLRNEIVFHFDVDQHSISLKQFIDTARASEAIIDDFNNHFFSKELKYELRVRPSEQGGFVEVIQFVLGGGAAAGLGVLGFLATDIGKAVFRGLTDEEPAAFAERQTRKLRQRVKGKSTELTRDDDDRTIGFLIAEPEFSDKEIAVRVVTEMLQRFLSLDASTLEKIGLSPAQLRKAYAARNTIFKACLDNPEVKALGFDRSHEFPLKRADFARQIMQIPDEVENESEKPQVWSVETVDIVVNSPNWKREGRKWQAATNKIQDIAFDIEDEAFWKLVETKEIQPDIKDNMRVQWAYPAGHSKPTSVRALRVLSYNGKPISTPLTKEQWQAELGESYEVENDIQDLFQEGRQDEKDNPNYGQW
ncbi:hypothetical protein ACFQ14_13520 [Pseudahrensia aquimaris]|uniref:Uncharacterized protein n=1 Tax=Pseudahrensia aquimaris TaxID=744461 RepID=A0ABW3FI18_9HYPH